MKYQKYENSSKTVFKDETKQNSIKRNSSKERQSKNNSENFSLKIISEKVSSSKIEGIDNNKFEKNIQNSQKEISLDIKEIIFNLLNNDEIVNIEQFSCFFTNEQKKINGEYNLTKKQNSSDKTNKFEELISLIARYFIIIHYLIQKKNLIDAKTLLLLMIKENFKHLESHILKLFRKYTKLQQKYEIINVYPKGIKELLKIYSILIKYCSLFNLSSYKNMFLVRYLSLHSLNYKVFKRKFEILGFSFETRNELKYLFSICLHYASILAAKYFCPLKVSISLSGLILKVYKNMDDNISTKKEKSLLFNTLYNQSVFYYLNNQSDSALRNLKILKQKIIYFYNRENMKNNIYHKFTRLLAHKQVNNEEEENGKIKKKNSFWKNLYRDSKGNAIKKSKDNPFNLTDYDFEQIFFNDSSRKKKLKIEDLFDINAKSNIKMSLRKSTSLINGKGDIDNLREQSLKIPSYLSNPLLFNIELFITEIEFDRKNYYMSYEHIKNCLLIILVLKNSEEPNNNIEKSFSFNTISNYLEEIKKKNTDKKLSSRIKSLQNLNLTLNQEEDDKLNIVDNNEKEIIKANNPINLNKEIEKLFLFLNLLSIYQIKIFNETQPNLDTRNDMPIFFSNQFKDSLTQKQRNFLDKLNIMSVSRSSLLLEPNQSILPSNLKLNYSNDKKNDSSKRKNQKNFFISFDGSLVNSNINNEDKKEEEDKILEFIENKELENLKELLISTNKNNKLKSYLINNIYFVCKILKNSNTEQIEEIIKYPEIIIEAIKLYKKNHKYDYNYQSIQKEIIKKLIENPQFKSILKFKKSLSKKKTLDKATEEKKVNQSYDVSNSHDNSSSDLE